ncbi:CocE/NonD family hydrolase C-terminal non-catalytic domain-containing protein [Aeromicrobium sp. UC242_57]|uniref:CocE/NonD family hydrolase C-terminal non-catalytic domain-containing protein n=1 Tax=Aeromicrobium sp. UC242_57 TaxID=3374624 RepID=UPI0037A52E1B
MLHRQRTQRQDRRRVRDIRRHETLTLQGPINARLWTSSIGGDGMLSVSLSDVAPDGKVSRLTGGWQVLSHRALDKSKSRYVDGNCCSPSIRSRRLHRRSWPVARWPLSTSRSSRPPRRSSPDSKLRLAVQAFDVPHLLPTLPDLLGTLTVMKIHSSAAYPSELTIPTVGTFASSTAVKLRHRTTPHPQDEPGDRHREERWLCRHRQGRGLCRLPQGQDRDAEEGSRGRHAPRSRLAPAPTG